MAGPAAFALWTAALFIVYTYVIPPLLIALLARLRPRAVARRAGHAPELSIVVAAHNEAARLEARIANLFEQDYPAARIEIIAVSDGSTDATASLLTRIAAHEPRLRSIELAERGGKAAALNAGVTAAHGELIVFADARQRFAPDALARLAENFADETVGCVSGELILTRAGAGGGGAEAGMTGVAEDVGLYWRYEKWMRRCESASGSMLGATGAIYAIRRALWRPLPPGALLDDFLTPMRIVLAGRRAIFDGRAAALDEVSQRGAQEFRRKARTLAGNYQAFAAEPAMLSPLGNPGAWLRVWSHKLFRLLVPWALAVMLVACCARGGWFYSCALGGQIAFYAAAALGWACERRGAAIPWRPISFAYTFVALNAAAVAGLWLWLSGAQAGKIWKQS